MFWLRSRMHGCTGGQRPHQGLVYEIAAMLERHSADVRTKRMADALGESVSDGDAPDQPGLILSSMSLHLPLR